HAGVGVLEGEQPLHVLLRAELVGYVTEQVAGDLDRVTVSAHGGRGAGGVDVPAVGDGGVPAALEDLLSILASALGEVGDLLGEGALLATGLLDTGLDLGSRHPPLLHLRRVPGHDRTGG